MNFFSSSVLALILLVACSKNTDPTINNDLLLTFTQDPSSPTTNSDNWIFVTDEAGNVLEVQQFEAGSTIYLRSQAAPSLQRINITHLNYALKYSEPRFYSYLGIPIGQKWTYDKVTNGVSTAAGPAVINIANYSNAPSFSSLMLAEENKNLKSATSTKIYL